MPRRPGGELFHRTAHGALEIQLSVVRKDQRTGARGGRLPCATQGARVGLYGRGHRRRDEADGQRGGVQQ